MDNGTLFQALRQIVMQATGVPECIPAPETDAELGGNPDAPAPDGAYAAIRIGPATLRGQAHINRTTQPGNLVRIQVVTQMEQACSIQFYRGTAANYARKLMQADKRPDVWSLLWQNDLGWGSAGPVNNLSDLQSNRMEERAEITVNIRTAETHEQDINSIERMNVSVLNSGGDVLSTIDVTAPDAPPEQSDIDALQAALDAAAPLYQYDYTAATWAILEDAVVYGEAVIADPNANVFMYHQATWNINQALNGLVLYFPSQITDVVYWGDSSDGATLTTGPNGWNAATEGSPCSIRINKAKGEPGPDIIVGGDFSDPSDWIQSGAVIEDGLAKFTSSGDRIQQSLAGKASPGDLLLCRWNQSGGSLRAYAGTTTTSVTPQVEGGGEKLLVVTMRGQYDWVRLQSATNADFSIDNFSAQVLPAGSPFQRQYTTAAKPTVAIVDGVQCLQLDGDDDSMAISVPAGGWAGTYVQGTVQGVIVGEFAAPEGPYQIPTDPAYANAGTDTQLVLVDRVLADHELEGLVGWVGQRCAVADFAGETDGADWFRFRDDLTRLDCSKWSPEFSSVVRFAFSCGNLVSALVGPVFSASTTNAASFMENTDSLQDLDLSGAESHNVLNWSRFLTRTGLTSLYLGDADTSGGRDFDFFVFASNGLESIDLSDNSFLSASTFARFADSCGNLTTVTVYGGNGSHFAGSPCIDYTNAFRDTNLSQQSYEDIVTAIESAGTSNGTLDITGGSATTTGAAQTAVDALRARGWTVTTPDGY